MSILVVQQAQQSYDHFLRVNAQMYNLDKQKTACSRETTSCEKTSEFFYFRLCFLL